MCSVPPSIWCAHIILRSGCQSSSRAATMFTVLTRYPRVRIKGETKFTRFQVIWLTPNSQSDFQYPEKIIPKFINLLMAGQPWYICMHVPNIGFGSRQHVPHWISLKLTPAIFSLPRECGAQHHSWQRPQSAKLYVCHGHRGSLPHRSTAG